MFKKIGVTYFRSSETKKGKFFIFLIQMVFVLYSLFLFLLISLVAMEYTTGSIIPFVHHLLYWIIVGSFYLLFSLIWIIVIYFSKEKNNYLITIYRAEKLKKQINNAYPDIEKALAEMIYTAKEIENPHMLRKWIRNYEKFLTLNESLKIRVDVGLKNLALTLLSVSNNMKIKNLDCLLDYLCEGYKEIQEISKQITNTERVATNTERVATNFLISINNVIEEINNIQKKLLLKK